MILGIGIDILSLARLQGVIARRGADQLAKRICCFRELDEFHGLTSSLPVDSRQLTHLQERFLSSR
jgi:holo-[acyl-carrier protein] synthase